MIRSSLAAKITLVIMAVSIIGFGASTIWTIHHESILAVDESKAAARLVTVERIRGHFVLESLGERTFKNVSAPIRAYRVIPPGVYEKVV